MILDVGKLVEQMLGAAIPILEIGGTQVKDYAETEFKKIGLQIEFVNEQHLAGKITDAGAMALVQMQVNSTKILLLTLEGLGLLTVEAGINAALAVVKAVVNTALGFVLIV